MNAYLYANRDDAWPDFTRHDVEIVDGRLVLARLPAPDGPPPPGLAALAPPDGCAGVAVAADGTVFTTVPGAVLRTDGCDGTVEPLTCFPDPGPAEPRGLLTHPQRHALLVADAGTHQVLLFDLATRQLLDVWGRFDTPVALGGGPDGRVYVADRHRVQQFTAGGQAVPGFWRTLSAEAAVADPVAVAVEGARVHILDRERRAVLVADVSGHLLDELAVPLDGDVLGLAATEDALYVGENAAKGGQVVRLRRDGSFVGAAPGYPGPVAALALDHSAGLLVHPGADRPPVRLALHAASVRRGTAWGGPFGGFTEAAKTWHRLAATMAAPPQSAHIRFFVHTTDDPAATPPIDPAGPDPFPSPAWSPGPPDLGEHLIDRPPARLAWIGLRFDGQGAGSPAVEQIRLEFDHSGYLEHLPAIYRPEPEQTGFLPRYLALVESLFGEVEAEVADLGRLLSPAAAPGPFLAELARWVGLEPSPTWTEAELRDAVAHALTEAADRGTAAGLRAALRRATSMDALVEEPIVQSAWWALAAGETSPAAERGTSVLGLTTVLAAAEPQGAILGSTAVVDGSHLISGDEFGAPLFESVAHRFSVRVYRGAAFSPERLRAVRELVDRERPVHTVGRVGVVEPRFAIGLQATIGVDAIVGGEPPATRLDDGAVLSEAFVLGGEPPGRVGERARIGVTTVLGS